MLSLLSIAFIAYNNLYIRSLEGGISLYNGLFNINLFTQSFNIFILFLASLIIFLTAIYPHAVKNIINEKIIAYSLYEIKKTLSYNSTEKIKVVQNSLSNNYTKEINEVKANIGVFSETFTIIEYALIIAFILCGAMFLMSTSDLISLFLSIELQSYGLYILATLYRNSESATKSGLTYFLLGGLSSCFILLGSAILYVNSGTTSLDNIYIINSIGAFDTNYNDFLSKESLSYYSSNDYETHQANYINLSFTILIVGFLFKISAAPFHFWSPDVYDGIPTTVTTFVAIIAKISLFVVLLELVTNTISNSGTDSLNNISIFNALSHKTFYLNNEWKNVLIFSSLASLIIGSLLGLSQYRLKRLFAYSTISHVGFILLALSINKIESIQGYIFYILQYSISNLNAFLLILAIGYSLALFFYEEENKEASLLKKTDLNDKAKFIDRKNSPIQLITQINGYFYHNQFLAISLAITLFSFIGIPPLIGFFAKQMVLSAALDEGYVFMVLIGVVTSVIGAGYYLNLVSLVFFNKPKGINYISNKNLNYMNDNYDFMINNYLAIIISLLTMIITLFIFVPGEWFRIVSILSLSICKL